MALVAPINLPYNVRSLWFDPNNIDINVGDSVVVQTVRGLELGVVASDVMEVDADAIKKLKSPLKPVLRLATDEDIEKAEEMEKLSREAMPVFRELARETCEDMHPVSVEYLLDGDKAIFYFESEERIDFRELVRKLASHFHVRIDMHQIGVRDEARIVGGIAHCGQEVCCKRMGGEFKPVSIRMAKDQDLSLNPQKISGLCGRLMCCLRYENDAYNDFKSRAPKLGAKINTPAGEAKVIDLDVPKEIVTVQIDDEKPVKVDLAQFDAPQEGKRPDSISNEAWEIANQEEELVFESTSIFSTSRFTGEDKLGNAKAIHHHTKEKNSDERLKSSASTSNVETHRKQRKRRSTVINGGQVTSDSKDNAKGRKIADNNSNVGSKNSASRKERKTTKQKPTSRLRPGYKSSGLSTSNTKASNAKAANVKQGGESASNKNAHNTGKDRNRRHRGKVNSSNNAKQNATNQHNGNQGKNNQNPNKQNNSKQSSSNQNNPHRRRRRRHDINKSDNKGSE